MALQPPCVQQGPLVLPPSVAGLQLRGRTSQQTPSANAAHDKEHMKRRSCVAGRIG